MESGPWQRMSHPENSSFLVYRLTEERRCRNRLPRSLLCERCSRSPSPLGRLTPINLSDVRATALEQPQKPHAAAQLSGSQEAQRRENTPWVRVVAPRGLREERSLESQCGCREDLGLELCIQGRWDVDLRRNLSKQGEQQAPGMCVGWS